MASGDAPIKSVSAERHDLVVVHQHCPQRPYLELTVPQDFGKPSFLHWTTDSRDQGWCTVQTGASWSWFDGVVRRPDGRNNLRVLRICDNRIGNEEFNRKTTHWDPKHPWGVNWKPWLGSLQPGDVLELVPRAIFPGWLNMVREAKIELDYEPAPDGDIVQGSVEALRVFNFDASVYPRRLDAELSEIRVLAIDPASDGGPIVCRLEYVRLDRDSPPAFDALSYSWGYPKDWETITVRAASGDGKQIMSITPSAADAIRRLRHPSNVVTLWIDAICINQDDSQEKAQQVSIMSSIYSSAQTVHIWLGEHQGVEAALEMMRDIHNWNRRVCEGGSACHCLGCPHTSIKDIMDWGGPDGQGLSSHRGIKAIFRYHWPVFKARHQPREYAGGLAAPHVSKLMSHVFDTPWFKRSWVLREVLGAHSALVHCAKATVTWEEVVDLNAWLSDPAYIGSEPEAHHTLITMPPVWSSLLSSGDYSPVVSAKHGTGITPDLPGILDVYLAALDLKSSMARDKLFALLSFGRETAHTAHLPAPLRPEYDKPTSEIFAGFTKWWIATYQSLAILSSIHADRARTWVRMISDATKSRPIPTATWTVPTDGTHRWSTMTLQQHFPRFHASSVLKPDLTLLVDTSPDPSAPNQVPLTPSLSPRLRLRGTRIAAINQLANFLPSAAPDEAAEVHATLLAANLSTEPWKERAVLVRPGRQALSASDIQRRHADHLGAHMAATTQSHGRGSGAPSSRKTLLGGTRTRDGALKWAAAEAAVGRVEACADACAFVLEVMDAEGRQQWQRWGLGPWRVQVGDLVVVLDGGDVPVLLRKRDVDGEGRECVITYELVGECFVEGIMYGEAVQGRTGIGEVFTLV